MNRIGWPELSTTTMTMNGILGFHCAELFIVFPKFYTKKLAQHAHHGGFTQLFDAVNNPAALTTSSI